MTELYAIHTGHDGKRLEQTVYVHWAQFPWRGLWQAQGRWMTDTPLAVRWSGMGHTKAEAIDNLKRLLT